MALSGSVSTSSYQGRYYKVSWSATQSVADNKSTISWSVEALGGTASWYAERTLKIVIGGKTVYSKSDRFDRYVGFIESGTTEITHNSDGKKSFEISVQAAVYYTTVNCTGSQTFELNPIARISTLTVKDGTLGTAQTLSVTEKVSSFEHKLSYSCGTASGYILGSETGTSTTNSISWTPPLSLASQNKKGRTVSVKFTLTTYKSGGTTLVGSDTYTKTFAIPNKLSSSLSISDATGKASTYGGYIKGISKLEVTVTPDTSDSYSPVSSYSTTVNDVTYTDATFTTDILKKSGNVTISAKVTDQRGDSYTNTQSVTVLDYTAPAISKLSVNRCKYDSTQQKYVDNDQGEYVKVTYSGAITSLNNKNSAKFQLKYKKSAEADSYYQTKDLSTSYTVTNDTYIFAADTSSSYDVQIVATDSFNSSTPTIRSTTASSAFTIMHFNASGNGMGLGKVCEFAGLDVGFTSRFNDDAFVGESTTWDDGLPGTKLSRLGGLLIQRANDETGTKNPYIDFRFNGTTGTYDGRIMYYDGSTKYMGFRGGGYYDFDNGIYGAKGLRLGTGDTTGKTAVNFNLYWADGSAHNIITRGSDGLTTDLGWTGSTTYKTVTNLKGQTVQCKGSTTWTSDQNLKHDIRDFDEKYDIFYANLKPRSYKYDLGSSGRTHIGYVTQEVEDALKTAGLSTQDFAGVVIRPINSRETEEDESGNVVDIEVSEDNYLLDKGIKEQHNLAYTEFIALNTYMIQKLLKENIELKERLSKLEASLNK